MSRLPSLLFVLLLLMATSAGARMYQWKDPESNSVQFSGVPPAWYRSPEGGPRVRVFDGGKLVDDTYIRLAPQDNRSMREIAFRVLQEEQEQEAIKRLERAARREEVRRQQEEREAKKVLAELEQSDTSQAPPEVLLESLDPEMVDRLKAIISAYDHANADEAGAAPPAAPPTGGTVTTTTNY
jgi:hypothetical protein